MAESNEDQRIDQIPQATSIAGAKMLGIAQNGDTNLFDINSMLTGYKGKAVASTVPGASVAGNEYEATPGVTYANFLNSSNQPISIPAEVDGKQVLTAKLRAIDANHWDAVYTPVTIGDNFINTSEIAQVVLGNLLNVNTIINDTYVNGEDGNLTYNSDGFETTDNITCEPNTQYFITGTSLDSYNRGIVYKDNSLSKVGFGYYGGSVGNQKSYFNFTTPANCFFFQLTYKTSAPGDNTNVNNVTIGKGELPITLPNYTSAINTVKDEKIFGVSIKEISSKNLFNSSLIFNGYIDGGSGIRNADTNYKTSGIIRVEPNIFITISGMSAKSFSRGYVFRNMNGEISSYGWLEPENRYTLKIPSNVYFLELTLKTGAPQDNTSLDNVQIEIGATATGYNSYANKIQKIDGYEMNFATIKTKGKKALIFGDSITTTTGQTNWPTYAKDILQLGDIINYATAGAAYRDRVGVDDLQKISYQVQQAIAIYSGFDPDIIVFNCGINDGIIDIGGFTDAMAKPTLPSLDRTKLYEALRWSYWSIKTTFPNAVVYTCLPLQTAYEEPSATEANRNAITAMGKRYNFIVIDQNSESGIIKDFEIAGGAGLYLADGLHPNQKGKLLQARYLSNKILANFH